MRDFHGVYVPVPTPFRGDEIAIERLRDQGESGFGGTPLMYPQDVVTWREGR